MKLMICADEEGFTALCVPNELVEWIRVSDPSQFADDPTVDGYFNLMSDAAHVDYIGLQQPVFINSVADTTLSADNMIRFNGWKGFVEKDSWEMAGVLSQKAIEILSAIHKTPIVTQNSPGFISARSIAMIVNEAYFALGDGISSEADIDIAMKLGTNYPFGPFEWGQKIGLSNLYELLQILASTDPRYECAPALKKLVEKQ